MDNLVKYKDEKIREYISSINFKNDFSVKQIKEDLRKYLDELPGIDIKYVNTEIIKEDANGVKTKSVVEDIKSIIVIFTNDNIPERREYFL